jgi:hypothetical protein
VKLLNYLWDAERMFWVQGGSGGGSGAGNTDQLNEGNVYLPFLGFVNLTYDNLITALGVYSERLWK